ncbi:MAG: hypothetical protein BMS9Abin23_0766 [Thermodesulfobacteriota bacterium]|nr:MAG: hypothetical protein BMS9Abin23_0766 [Thermodesulfobacteriota bacterium]
MKRYRSLSLLTAVIILLAVFIMPKSAFSGNGSQELTAIKKNFGPVLKLEGTPAGREINAIANLLVPGSGMMAIDFTGVSGEFCMLEPGTKRYMIHFSNAPEKTTEDILYFINPESFKKAGLKVAELPVLPTKLGKMKPLQWYYYSGKVLEPHHGKKMGKEFLVMAIDVK